MEEDEKEIDEESGGRRQEKVESMGGAKSTREGRMTGCSSLDELEKSLLQMSIEHSIRVKSRRRVEISGPLHLQEDKVSSYPPATTTGAVHASWVDGIPSSSGTSLEDQSELEEESIDGSRNVQASETKFDPKKAIQNYVDKVCLFRYDCFSIVI